MAFCRPMPHSGRVFAAAGGARWRGGRREDRDRRMETQKHVDRWKDERRVKASNVTASSSCCWHESLWCFVPHLWLEEEVTFVVRLTKVKKANVWHTRRPDVTQKMTTWSFKDFSLRRREKLKRNFREQLQAATSSSLTSIFCFSAGAAIIFTKDWDRKQ